MIQQVSDSELELMKIIWEKEGSLLYAQIMEALEKQGIGWQKNTVITLLSRLVVKGLIKINKIGRRNEYTAIVTEADYQAAQTKSFLEKLYKGDAKRLVATLLQEDMLTVQNLEDLKTFWEMHRILRSIRVEGSAKETQ